MSQSVRTGMAAHLAVIDGQVTPTTQVYDQAETTTWTTQPAQGMGMNYHHIHGPSLQSLLLHVTAEEAALIATAPELLAELEAAHRIIRHALAVMTIEQKAEWGRLNAGADVDGEGITRANERAAVIVKAGGAA